MTRRDGRQLIERALEHLNYERAITRDDADWLAYVEASESCASIIRNWHKPAWFWNRAAQTQTMARKAAA